MKSIFVFISLSIFIISANGQADSIVLQTPFVKGKWINGLSGSIKSSSLDRDSVKNNTSNEYRLNLGSSKFIRDRLSLGFLLQLSRLNSEGVISENSEIFQVGPLARYYTSESQIGSFFFQGVLSYVKYQESLTIDDTNSSFETKTDGKGIGFLLGLGYSYAISDWVIFDLAISYDTNWIDAKTNTSPSFEIVREDLILGAVSYSFGFNILINEFFF